MSASQAVVARAREHRGVLSAVRSWPAVLCAAVVTWSIAFLWTVRSDYLNFRVAKYDLGNMVQAVWSTAHGRPLEVTLATGEQASRLSGHVDPILVALAPLWLLAPSPLTLAAVQVAAVSLGALPLFWLGRKHLASERTAGLVALAYLASPWVIWNALDVFHPVTLALPLFLLGFWFLDGDRVWAFAVCGVPILLAGELMGLSVAALGIWYAVARGRRAGYAIALAGALSTAVALYVVVPAFSGRSSVFYGYYEDVGGSPLGVARTAVTHPSAIVSALTTWTDVRLVIALSLPLVGLFVLSPAVSAIALPQLLVNGLSVSPIMMSPGHHHAAVVLAFLFAATVLGLARVAPARQTTLATLVLVTSCALALFFGAWPGAPDSFRLVRTDHAPAKVEALRTAVALVPPNAPVAVTNLVGSHLSARRRVFIVPTVKEARWIVVDASDTWIPWIVAGKDEPGLLHDFIVRVESSPRWGKVFERDGVYVFRRTSGGGGGT